jgi:hypothetical protein
MEDLPARHGQFFSAKGMIFSGGWNGSFQTTASSIIICKSWCGKWQIMILTIIWSYFNTSMIWRVVSEHIMILTMIFTMIKPNTCGC